VRRADGTRLSPIAIDIRHTHQRRAAAGPDDPVVIGNRINPSAGRFDYQPRRACRFRTCTDGYADDEDDDEFC